MRYYRTSLRLIFITLLAITSLSSYANSAFDYYSDRPDVTKIEPDKDAKLRDDWHKFNIAQLEFLAQLFGLYPNEVIYFLARDGEYLFDLAQILGKKFPELKNRARLINVSRTNLNNSLLPDYLKQEGLTEIKIKKTGVVFVDSGYKGSIPIHIKTLYSNEAQEVMFIHLAFSMNSDIPGSKSILIDTNINGANYEQMARYYRRSTGFDYWNGKIVPVSPISPYAGYNEDGLVDKKTALEYLNQLVIFGESPENLQRFQTRIKQWLFLTRKAESERASLKDIFLTLQRISREWTHPRSQALITDFVDYHRLSYQTQITLQSVRPVGTAGLEFDPLVMLSPILESPLMSYNVQNLTNQDLKDFAFLTAFTLEKTKKDIWLQIGKIWSLMDSNQFSIYLNSAKSEVSSANFERLLKIIHSFVSSSNSTAFKDALKKVKKSKSNSCKKVVGK